MCTDANETYEYWADTNVPENTKVLHGQYWSTPHFFKEYELYMEIEAPWVKDFITYNQVPSGTRPIKTPANAPKWFSPPENFPVWTGAFGSVYFIDTVNMHMFMYEKQY